MSTQKTILLKITGELLKNPEGTDVESKRILSLAKQIKELSTTHYFGIVVGGGNFFRGNQEGKKLKISPSIGHQVGMLATMMNGLIIKDLFEHSSVPCTLMCAMPSQEIGKPISHQAITTARNKKHCVIFTGGTGNPFFTTDTTAVLRGLQIQAAAVWKGTNVKGVYSQDPKKNPHATLLKHVTYEQALMDNLTIMDSTAFALAKEYTLPIRVFDIFTDNALIKAATDKTFGSIIES